MSALRIATGIARALGLLLLAPGLAGAVVLNDEDRITVKLSDNTDVSLIGEAGVAGKYYYLPTGLRIGTSAAGRPEFLFQKFVTNQATATGGVAGANLHFLMQWGLSVPQEAELREKLRSEHSNAQLAGAVPMVAGGDGDAATFEIISAVLSNNRMTPSVVTSGRAPLLPSGKAAAAASVDANGAQLLAQSLSGPANISDVSVSMQMAYETQLPAIRGRIVADWERVQRERESLSMSYRRTQTGREETDRNCFMWVICTSGEANTYAYSYNEIQDQFKFLMEQKVIDVTIEETISDERVAKIRDAFLQYFINSMTEQAQPEARSTGGTPAEEAVPDIKKGSRYVFSREKIRNITERKREVHNLNYKLAVRWPLQIVGNLKSWYGAVASDPQAVQEIVLDDPFFQHRDIVVLVDVSSREIFKEQINALNVNVRKRRDDGTFWSDAGSLNYANLEALGGKLQFSFARGSGSRPTNPDPDTYEYKYQWRVGGAPADAGDGAWQKGEWTGVVLSAPIVARDIEFEGNLDELKASHITRATAQVRYRKNGDEREANLPLSVAEGKALAKQRIYLDAGEKGYVYRLVLHHTREGSIALPWSARQSDDYIYALIPPEILQEAPAALAEARTAAGNPDPGVTARIDELLPH